MDNKEISSTESEQANSNINKKETTQDLFRELLNKFDGLNTRLTNIETNIVSISNVMMELNGVKRLSNFHKTILVEACMRSKMSKEKLQKARTSWGKSMMHSRRRSMT